MKSAQRNSWRTAVPGVIAVTLAILTISSCAHASNDKGIASFKEVIINTQKVHSADTHLLITYDGFYALKIKANGIRVGSVYSPGKTCITIKNIRSDLNNVVLTAHPIGGSRTIMGIIYSLGEKNWLWQLGGGLLDVDPVPENLPCK